MSRFRRLFRHEESAERVDNAIDDELAFHFEMTLRELADKGYAPEEAQREARRRFGNERETRDRLRSVNQARVRTRRRAAFVDVCRQQFVEAVRGLRRQPLLTVAIVAMFALGLGANAAMFTIIDRLLLRPPAGIVRPEEIHRIFKSRPDQQGVWMANEGFAYVDVEHMRARLDGEAQVAAYAGESGAALGRGSAAPRVDLNYVSKGYFDLLGVRPALGRFFTTDEIEPRNGPSHVAVISHYVWREVFGADASVIGKVFQLDRRPFTIIGVAAKGFDGPDASAVGVWLPASEYSFGNDLRVWLDRRSYTTWRTLLRPKIGVTAMSLRQPLLAAYRASISQYTPDSRDTTVRIIPAPLLVSRGPGEAPQGVSIAYRLAGVAALILLIACFNIAHLLLVRALQRQKEVAVRLALGISRARLASQLLLEGVLLSLLGAAGALVVAQWGGSALRALLLPYSRWASAPLDARIVAFTVVVAIVVGVATAFVPSLQSARRDILDTLRTGLREGVQQRSRLRGTLVIAQAALSVVLLVGAGVFVRSLQRAAAIDVGLDVDRLIFARAPNPADTLQARMHRVRLDALLDRVRQIPGVEAVAYADPVPLDGAAFGPLFIDGRDSVPSIASGPPTFARVSAEYFKVSGSRILAGRGITADDRIGAPPVVVVNETMAKTVWPAQSPIGRCIRVDSLATPCVRVVGIAEDSHRMRVVEPPTMQYFLPLAQRSPRIESFLIRANPSAHATIIRLVERELYAMNPDGTFLVRPLQVRVDAGLRTWRTSATLFGLCGVLALIVTTMGVYSAVAYGVSQRRHEFGVRLALGAQLRDVARHVMVGGLRSVAIGIGLGLVISVAAGRLVAALLYDTKITDPTVLVGVTLVLTSAAVVACLLPSWRAARTDPLDALKAE